MEKIVILYISFFILFEEFLLYSYYARIKYLTPENYITLSEISKSIYRNHYIIRYFIFRLLPVLALLLFNLILIPYIFPQINYIQITIINLFLVVVDLTMTNIKAIKDSKSRIERVSHMLTCILIVILPFLAYALYPHIKIILPEPQGLIDNIWSSTLLIFLASMTIWYTNINLNKTDKEIIQRKLGRWSQYIYDYAKKYNADSDLIGAIVYFESLQRPNYVRFVESIVARFNNKGVSQGVMQVKHIGYLSDQESINRGVSKYLKNSCNLDMTNEEEIRKIIKNYNNSETFQNEVVSIYKILKN